MAAIQAMFAKKMPAKAPPKFAGEKPPSGEDDPRGGASGADEMPAMAGSDDGGGAEDPGGMPGGDADPETMALDELADIVGIAPTDREDFGNAMKAYVQACMMSGGGEEGEPGADGVGDEGSDEQE